MQKALLLSVFLTTFCYSNSPIAVTPTFDLEQVQLKLHTIFAALNSRSHTYLPCPTRQTGGQAIARFGAVVHKVGMLLPPPQAAILEAMSMAITFVAGCVDADEKQQEYLEYLQWKEGQQKSIVFVDTNAGNVELTYAISAMTHFYEELFKPQRTQIMARVCSSLAAASATESGFLVINKPLQTSELESFFENLSLLFAHGIEILKQVPSESTL